MPVNVLTYYYIITSALRTTELDHTNTPGETTSVVLPVTVDVLRDTFCLDDTHTDSLGENTSVTGCNEPNVPNASVFHIVLI